MESTNFCCCLVAFNALNQPWSKHEPCGVTRPALDLLHILHLYTFVESPNSLNCWCLPSVHLSNWSVALSSNWEFSHYFWLGCNIMSYQEAIVGSSWYLNSCIWVTAWPYPACFPSLSYTIYRKMLYHIHGCVWVVSTALQLQSKL